MECRAGSPATEEAPRAVVEIRRHGVYLHVRQPHLQSTPSPLDWLPVRQLPSWQQEKDKKNIQQKKKDGKS